MINKKSILNRLIIYTVEGYLQDIDPDETYLYEFFMRLRTGIRMHIKGHRFSKEEFAIVDQLSRTKEMEDLSEQLIDRVIYALELLLVYIEEIPKQERAIIGVGDKKIIEAKSNLIKDMIRMRINKPDAHKKVKEIILDSRINAKRYFEYCKREVL